VVISVAMVQFCYVVVTKGYFGSLKELC